MVIFLGVSAILASFLTWQRNQNFLAQAYFTEATVSNLIPSTEKNGSLSYSPEIVFLTPQGSVIYILEQHSNPAPFEKGERIQIFYNPTFYPPVIIDSFWFHSGYFFFILIGIICIGVGGFYGWRKKVSLTP